MTINEIFNTQREDLYPALIRLGNAAKKQKDATAYLYYTDAARKVTYGELTGVVDFERFINSWAGEEWFKKNKKRIEDFASEEQSRYGKKWMVS